jgi:hypothetical protein
VGLAAGALFFSAGTAVLLLNVLYRIGVEGDKERDTEQSARDFFDEHGHWPDEEPPRSEPRPDPHRHRPGPHPPHGADPGGRAGSPARRRPRRP